MVTQFAENYSDGFGEFWTGDGQESASTSGDWESEIPYYMPESTADDPVWIELADNGIGIRDAIAIALPALAELDDDELDAEIADVLSGMSEAEIEGFFDFVKKAARGALRVAAPLAGVAGRVVGTAIGGPVGTMVGGMAGDLLGRGAQALDRQLARPSRRRRGGASRGRRVRRSRSRRVLGRYGQSLGAGINSMVRAAAPAVGQLGMQLQNPAAGASLGQAAGRQIAHVAGRLSNIINSQEMQLALSNAAAGLPAEISNSDGAVAEASVLAEALRQAIIEAAEVVESIQTEAAMPISSGMLAEFVGQ